MDANTLRIATELRRSLARLSRRLRLETSQRGLSGAKHSVLGHLYRGGASTPGSLASAESVKPQSVTRLLAELERSGLVMRTQDETDRRQFKVELTAGGREVVQREARQRALWLASAMNSYLTPLERELLGLSAKLLDTLAASPCHDAST